MLQYFRRRRALPLIAKALAEHPPFESAHRQAMAALLTAEICHPPARTIVLFPNLKRTRDLGEYDRDQLVERIVGEVLRSLGKKKPPKKLRQMVEDAL